MTNSYLRIALQCRLVLCISRFLVVLGDLSLLHCIMILAGEDLARLHQDLPVQIGSALGRAADDHITDELLVTGTVKRKRHEEAIIFLTLEMLTGPTAPKTRITSLGDDDTGPDLDPAGLGLAVSLGSALTSTV